MDISLDRAALRRLFTDSRTVAVVGASPNPTRDSHRIARYLLSAGYEVIPVNPGHDSLLGRPCYRSLRDIPVPVDIVDIFRRREHTPPVVDDAIAIGARCVWFQLDTTDEGAARRADDAGLLVVRDSCAMVAHRELEIPRRA
jgi:hypothetical protein